VTRHAVVAVVALCALAGHVGTRLAVGQTSPIGDRSDIDVALARIDDSRRLFALSHWLFVVALIATVVAMALHLTLAGVGEQPPNARPAVVVAMSGLLVWTVCGIVAAAARAQLVRWDFSLPDSRGTDERIAFLAHNLAEYAWAFGLLGFGVGMVATARALSAEFESDPVVPAAVFAALCATPAALGPAFLSFRDGRFRDTSAFRPGSGADILVIVAWVVVLAAIAVAGFTRRSPAGPRSSRGGPPDR